MAAKKVWNTDWKFTKSDINVIGNSSITETGEWEILNLPHTWNGIDGQDGGNDYYRGTCYYAKSLSKADLPAGEEIYIQFEGANSSADLYVNGKKLAHHDGGYSTWRVNLTAELLEENEIVVAVDNSKNETVYPQNADFTFYGGLYRDVTLIGTSTSRFNLDYYGTPGVAVTPIVEGTKATVTVEAFLTGIKAGQKLSVSIINDGNVIASKEQDASETKAVFEIENPHLWHGRKDPHLYITEVKLLENETVLDERVIRFGIRSFVIDAQRGFILNGEEYPLRGVSRHQDRPVVGNALSHEDHIEDMNLICELGATTIRLAHYQHDQFFYDLCDERGLCIWAEIPYISSHMPNGRENTISQMKELIVQNYNHPSIVVWGLSNEITMGGKSDADLIENHHILNDMCHDMDKTRPTTMAIVSMCDMNDPYVRIPDTRSWNHYFGWYGGDTSMNGPWLDDFHAKYPDEPVGMSEYGCEALNWHNSNPKQGDYSEEYQAYYHEELIKQLFTRKYLWATHVWNMFDFAADARAEGGEDGMNHKGLVTFDRKYKKDAFYAYKAWLSDEPFVHICGKRYVDRVEDVTKVTVYSNLPEVELFANGISLGKQTSDVHFFYFEVPNTGRTTLKAVAGQCSDMSTIIKVDEPNPSYILNDTIGGEVLNWFDIETPDGYFNINDTIADIMANPQGQAFFGGLMKQMMPSNPGGMDIKPEQSEGLMKMMAGFTVKRILSMAGTMGGNAVTKDQIIALNKQLNQIKK